MEGSAELDAWLEEVGEKPSLAIVGANDEWLPELGSVASAVVADEITKLAPRLGRAGRLFVAEQMTWSVVFLGTNEAEDEKRVRKRARAAWIETKTTHGLMLWREKQDEDERAAAAVDDAAAARYLAKWERRLERVAMAYPRRWRVPNFTVSELKAEVSLALLEALRVDQGFAHHERPAQEASFVAMRRTKDRLRTRRKVFEVLEGSLPEIASGFPAPDEHIERAERDRQLRELFDRPDVLERLSRTQREWLWRFRKHAAHPGRFSAAAVADEHNRNRASAARAREAIAKALTRAGARELL